ncbi:hypothetical protein NE865_06119 [Phthorimaea operculella]|nr:hypothetical protein NE865_06119 [Phthorimaea operculella]
MLEIECNSETVEKEYEEREKFEAEYYQLLAAARTILDKYMDKDGDHRRRGSSGSASGFSDAKSENVAFQTGVDETNLESDSETENVVMSANTTQNTTSRQMLLSTALVAVYDSKGKQHTARIMLDNASTTHLVTQEFVVLELAQDIAQAAADISRRRDGKEKPFRGKVGQGLQVPLPPVTVPVFAGDYADWPAFEDLYSSVVHTRTDITPAYKMAQLMSRLHGEPHELLTHLAVSDSNYEVAWKILTDRYRNKRLIVDRLLDQWLSIPTITRGTDLREKIFHPVSVAVSALERQGLPVAGYGYILVHTVLRRLPSEMVARFEQLHGASPRTTSRPTRI